MQPDQKYKLSEPTQEEKDSFMKDFEELLKKHSIYFEPVPQFARDNITSPWKVICQIFLQKKAEIIEVEKDSIPSSFKENEEIDPTSTD